MQEECLRSLSYLLWLGCGLLLGRGSLLRGRFLRRGLLRRLLRGLGFLWLGCGLLAELERPAGACGLADVLQDSLLGAVPERNLEARVDRLLVVAQLVVGHDVLQDGLPR